MRMGVLVLPMRSIISVFTGAMLIAAPGLAQVAAAPDAPKIYRLTPDQIEAARNTAAERPDGPALTASAERDAILNNSLYTDGEAPARRRIHGEAGFFIGTGGARGFYGSTAVPLGETGTLGLSFSTGRLPGYGYGNRGYGGYRNGYGNLGAGLGYPY